MTDCLSRHKDDQRETIIPHPHPFTIVYCVAGYKKAIRKARNQDQSTNELATQSCIRKIYSSSCFPTNLNKIIDLSFLLLIFNDLLQKIFGRP